MTDSRSIRRDLWRYANRYPDPPAEPFRLAGPREFTPVEQMDSEGCGICMLKREDLNPAGSHKERAACYQVSKLYEQHRSVAVISSTGNAARAAARYMHCIDGRLIAMMSPQTHAAKIEVVLREKAFVILTPKPINHTRYAARIFNLPNLRPSIDPQAVSGFMSLGFEIHEQFPGNPPDAVFLFSTSGASLLGIARAFEIIVEKLHAWPHYPRLHAVQAGNALQLAENFDAREISREPDSLAGRGGLSVSRLAQETAGYIRKTGGSAWAIRNQEIAWAEEILSSAGIETSAEGAASLAALRRYRSTGEQGTALVILTGDTCRQTEPSRSPRLIHARGYLDIKREVTRIMDIDR
jgi:threonine synthase